MEKISIKIIEIGIIHLIHLGAPHGRLFKVWLPGSVVLHHLINQGSDGAVLGENLAVVTGQLYSPLRWIVHNFDRLAVLGGPLVVFILAPLCRGQDQPEGSLRILKNSQLAGVMRSWSLVWASTSGKVGVRQWCQSTGSAH